MKRVKTICSVLKAVRKQMAGALVVVGISAGLSVCLCGVVRAQNPIPNPCYLFPVQEKVYEVVEQMPSFPGGTAKLLEYLKENLRYPKELDDTCIQGRVIVGFVVEKDGSISNVKVRKGLHPLLDAEAVRVVSAMPKWIPGRQNGVVLRVKYYIPITFRQQ